MGEGGMLKQNAQEAPSHLKMLPKCHNLLFLVVTDHE